MGVSWTTEQKQVIDSRNQTLLVSAAAGSGKTAVLVQRVIDKILRMDDPVDIDHMLIVTFTKAAAGEMKERILQAIRKALESDPENDHLQKQLAYIHNAKITTIHSFCYQIIKEHFHELAIDPSVRVGEDGELNLLKMDVLHELLEDAYKEASPQFLRFVEEYAYGKQDTVLEDLVLSLYDFSRSYPWPEEWFTFCEDMYFSKNENLPWLEDVVQDAKEIVDNIINQTNHGISICNEDDGPYLYVDLLNSELQKYRELCDLINQLKFDEIVHFLDVFSFQTLPRKKQEGVDEGKKKKVKELRDAAKEGIAELKKKYFYQTLSEHREQMASCEAVSTLIALVKEFEHRFQSAKNVKNIVDFNDLEHLALQVLVQKNEDGTVSPTMAAKALSEEFHEIMIDEYQDSNQVQDYILTSISGQWEGRYNMFRVGDVKQSIYRFRMACPELFLQKLNQYQSDENAKERKIILAKNFRSRDWVVHSVNTIFSQIMQPGVGGITYDEDAYLYQGANYPEIPVGQDNRTEFLLLTDEKEESEEEEFEESTQIAEARLVAKRIKDLLQSDFQVVDKKTGEYRPINYGDIVILLRSISGWGEVFADVLLSEGIPAYCETSTGYFNTTEVNTVLSLLTIIDNPRNDIPLASVLHSPIVGLDNTALAVIKTEARDYFKDEKQQISFYECVRFYCEHGSNTEIVSVLRNLFEQIHRYQSVSNLMGMGEFLTYILMDTGYLNYVTSMPSGDRRRGNLEMLIAKAEAYEQGSYRGLFRFLHYVKQLRKYEVDYGEAMPEGGVLSVRIMSIHKSKGLEFPVVFVSGLGKRFNMQDTMEKMLLHSELGIGSLVFHDENRSFAPTILKNIIARRMRIETLGEELRILYVALTRAKEKLIMTGYVGSIETDETKLDRWFDLEKEEALVLPSYTISRSQCMLDWIGRALIRTSAAKPIYEAREEWRQEKGVPIVEPFYGLGMYFKIQLLKQPASMEGSESMDEANQLLERWKADAISVGIEDAQRLALIFKQHEEEQVEGHMAAKYSVSEIKHMYMEDVEAVGMNAVSFEDQEELDETGEDDASETKPVAKKTLRGAERGTAYHKFLELWPYQTSDYKAIRPFCDFLLSSGIFTKEEHDCIWEADMYHFINSPIGMRMKTANQKGLLSREKQFVMQIPAQMVDEHYEGKELVLVQGMIDAYFEEEDGLVLVDYKTDRVKKEEELVKRYKVQVELYKQALEQAMGIRVKGMYLYSFSLEKEIEV